MWWLEAKWAGGRDLSYLGFSPYREAFRLCAGASCDWRVSTGTGMSAWVKCITMRGERGASQIIARRSLDGKLGGGWRRLEMQCSSSQLAIQILSRLSSGIYLLCFGSPGHR